MKMVDTNVVVDLIQADPEWSGWSKAAVGAAIQEGPVYASTVVLGELAVRIADLDLLRALLADFALELAELDAAAAHRAGRAQAAYRSAGGARDKLLGDFLIGGHAESVGSALITRDARPYRRFFPDLALITPETHP
jgi:predicted nucleic acid-binding protein